MDDLTIDATTPTFGLVCNSHNRRLSDGSAVAYARLFRSPVHTPDFSPSPPLSACGGDAPPSPPPEDSEATQTQQRRKGSGGSSTTTASVTWKDVRDCFASTCETDLTSADFLRRRERFLMLWTACTVRDQKLRDGCLFL